MKKRMTNNIQRACWIFNDVSNPAKLRTNHEHRINRKAQRKIETYINKHYLEGHDYKEFANGMLYPIN